jgi:hypothetical protein
MENDSSLLYVYTYRYSVRTLMTDSQKLHSLTVKGTAYRGLGGRLFRYHSLGCTYYGHKLTVRCLRQFNYR